jgi:O-antigen/teichoic acid export membrane protein
LEKELTDITKKSSYVFAGKIIGVIFGLIMNLVIARLYGAELYGRFIYIYTFISFFPSLTSLGLRNGLIYFIPKYTTNNDTEKRNTLITNSFILTSLLSVIIIVVISLNSDFISTNLLNNSELSPLIKIMSPLIILLTLNTISQGVFRGKMEIKDFIIGKDLLMPSIKLIVVTALYFLGLRIEGLILGYYIGFIVLIVYYLIKIILNNNIKPKDIRLKNRKLIYTTFKFSLPLFLTGFLTFFVNKTDTFMIGYFLEDVDVGIYNIALRIGTMSSFILIAFNTTFAPMISNLYEKNKIKELGSIYKIITKWILTINLIAFSLFILFSNEIMLFFGQEFTAGAYALIFIGVGQIVNVMVGPAGYLNIMTGKPQYELYSNIIVLILNIILNYIMIPIYGINGAAIASAISVGFTNVMRLILVYKDLNIHPYNISYFNAIISIVASLIVSIIFNSVLNIFWITQVVLVSLFMFILFIIIYYYIGFSDEDLFILNKIKNKALSIKNNN